MKNILKKFDDRFIDLINKRMRSKYFDYIMPKLTNLGGPLFSSSILFILLLFGNRKYKLIGFEMFSALTISQIIVHSLKRMLSRERPYKILEQLTLSSRASTEIVGTYKNRYNNGICNG